MTETKLGEINDATAEVNGWRRQADTLKALGVIAAAPENTASAAVQSSQTIYGWGFYLYEGEEITNVGVCVQTAASGTEPTGIYLGVWSSEATPKCLAASANEKAAAGWKSQGWLAVKLASVYKVPSSGLYYAAYLINGAFGTTNLQLAEAGFIGPPGSAMGTGARLYGALKTSATEMKTGETGTYGNAGAVPLFRLS